MINSFNFVGKQHIGILVKFEKKIFFLIMESDRIKCLNYDGHGDPKEFIKNFQLQAAMFSWSKEKQIFFLPNMLSGKAERLYNVLSTDSKKEPDVILKAISSGYFLQKFYNSKPVNGDLLYAYALKLEDLLDKASPGLGSAKKNVFLRSQLDAYLPKDIQCHQSQTWDDLLVALDSSHPYIIRNVVKETNCVTFKNESLAANKTNSRNTFNGTRHGCKEVGHKRYELPERRRLYNNRSSNYNSSIRDNRGHNPGNNYGNRDNRVSNCDSKKQKSFNSHDRAFIFFGFLFLISYLRKKIKTHFNNKIRK